MRSAPPSNADPVPRPHAAESAAGTAVSVERPSAWQRLASFVIRGTSRENTVRPTSLQTAQRCYDEWLSEHEGLADAVALMYERGYARDMPDLSTQVTDESRTTTYLCSYGRKYDTHTDETYEHIYEQTEHQGLQHFWNTFQAISQGTGQLRMRPERYPNSEAKSLLQDMSFLGRHEFETSALLAAAYIKSWLINNPDGQLCLVPFISELTNETKSDLYVQDAILAHFCDEELDAYKGRMVFNVNDMNARLPADKQRILIADDCIITGRQMDAVHLEFKDRYPRLAGKLELLTFVAAPEFPGSKDGKYPVVSCYRARSRLITSLHCTSQWLADRKQEFAKGQAFHILKRANIHTNSSKTPGLLRVLSPYLLDTFTTSHIDRACRVLGTRPPTDL